MSLGPTRFRSIVSYEQENGALGCCCFIDGTYEYLNFSQCKAKKGIYNKQSENFSANIDLDIPSGDGCICPQYSELGYCCSCSNLTDDEFELFYSTPDHNSISNDGISYVPGFKQGFTQCKCAEIGGIWMSITNYESSSPGQLPQQCSPVSGIPGEIDDVRWKHSCCYLTENQETICENVCSENDCALVSNNQTATFILHYLCDRTGPANHDPTNCSSDSLLRSHFSDSTAEKYSYCTYIDGGIAKCSINSEKRCKILSGFFHGSDGENNYRSCSNSIFVNQAETKTDSIIKTTLTTSDLSNLNPGDDVGFGIYCGIFSSSSLISSSGMKSGIASLIRPNFKEYKKTEYKKHAIIIDYADTKYDIIDFSFYNTSDTNGKKNTYHWLKDSMKIEQVKKHIINNISGWYIGAIDEYGFIQQHLFNSVEANKTLKENKKFQYPTTKLYTSSTSFVVNNLIYKKSYKFSTKYNYKILSENLTEKQVKIHETLSKNINSKLNTGPSSVVLTPAINKQRMRLLYSIPITD